MEVAQVLHMNGGTGETSYAKNSTVQQKVISMTMPITEEAITKLYITNLPTSLAMADLGCSSGPNTLLAVSELIKAVDGVRRKLGRESPEYQVYLNDLPGNDFNATFSYCLPGFQEKQMGDGVGPVYFNGVPGSFYGRLFPRRSLHFIHSSYSLMWLSQVPKGVEDNKGNIYMASTSPPKVLKAYYEQFQNDFSLFLRCRAEELVPGGRMVLTILGRKSEDRSSKECCYIWELLALALTEIVQEGLIDEEDLDAFNIPQYTPSPLEVRSEVDKEGSFVVDRLEVSETNWNVKVDDDDDKNNNNYNNNNNNSNYDHEVAVVGDIGGGYNVAMCMRAVAEPLLVSHFGEGIIEEVFARYKAILADRLARDKASFVNVVVSVTRS